jgi:protein-S-isoprenylcysteine O-methyltransferase Ste14
MSHRTRDLAPRDGVGKAIRELRYHEVSRQALGVLLILLYTVTAQPTTLLVAVGLPMALVGMAIRLYASGFIMKNAELASSGPYALVRHPLYSGNILVLVGIAVANGGWWSLPLAVLFFWFYYPPAIEYEDRKLHQLFGAEWERWASKVPALVPSFKNTRGLSEGSWSLRKSFRKNGEVVIVVYILICAAWIAQRVL